MKTLAKSLLSLTAAIIAATPCMAQNAGPFGFGGQQLPENVAKYSSKVTDINYAGDTDVWHNLDIYYPENGDGPFPVVVHIYGSAWFSNNSKGMADINTICAELLKEGYAIVTPNHRASTDAKYPAQINDIKAVVRFLRGNAEKYNLNPDFIGISGFSSGAHLASLMGATNGVGKYSFGDVEMDIEGTLGNFTSESSKVNCVCEWSGPIDLVHMDCAGPRDWNPSPEEVIMGMPLTGNEDSFKLLSPVYFLDPTDPAFLVFHGTADNVVPVCQGRIMAETLENAGVKYEYVEVPEGGHGFNMYTPENLQKMVEFFNANYAATRK